MTDGRVCAPYHYWRRLVVMCFMASMTGLLVGCGGGASGADSAGTGQSSSSGSSGSSGTGGSSGGSSSGNGITINVQGTSGTVNVDVTAKSPYGIVSVSATLDGASLGVLTGPNTQQLLYRFTFDGGTVGSGSHTFAAQATDGNGATLSGSTTLTINNPPFVTLASPFDGQLVNGTLPLTGTFRSDKPGVTVSLAMTLNGAPVANAASSPFSSSVNVAGFAAGNYPFVVTATDSTGLSTSLTGLVTVTSSPALAYSPTLKLGADAMLLAVSSGGVLYKDVSGALHVHRSAGDTTYSLGGINNPGKYRLTDDGHVFVDATGPDRPGYSVYMWAPGATNPQNLSLAAGSTSIGDELVQVHFPWLLWAGSFPNKNWSQYTLRNVLTGENLTVNAPAGAPLVGNNECDFTTLNGSLRLFFWAESQNAALQYTYNVYSWDQSSGATTQLSSDDHSVYPQTDGASVVWKTKLSPSAPSVSYGLVSRDIASGSMSTLSSTMTFYQLDAGVTGWLDETYSTFNNVETLTTRALRASNGTTTTLISNFLNIFFYGSSGGYVVFVENGKLYAWSFSGGRQLLLDVAPYNVYLAGKTVYFTNGTQQVLYSVTLS